MFIRPRYRPQTFAIRTLTFLALSVCVLFASTAAQAQTKLKPIGIVTVNSIDHLFQDADFIVSLAGMPPISGQYQPMLAGMAAGLDQTRPIGLIVQSDGTMPSGAICLPVTNLKQLLGVLVNFGVTSEDGPNGTIQIGAQGQTLYAKEANGWALISMMPHMLEGIPADPGKLFEPLAKEYDLGVRVHAQNVPEASKQLAFSALQDGLNASMRQMPNETDEAFSQRQEMSKLQIEHIKQSIEDLDEITFGVAIDSQKQRTYFDFIYTAVAGSKLAEQIAINNDPKTDFAGFFQPDAAMTMSFSSKASEQEMAQIEQSFGALTKQLETAAHEAMGSASDEERALASSAVADFMDAFIATVRAGRMDGGAVLNVSPNSLSFVAGGLTVEPQKIESGVKKALELAKNKIGADFPAVNWNASSHKDVQFHTINVPTDGDNRDAAQARQLFGDSMDVVIGIGQKSAYFSLGRDSIDAVKRVMDASAASPQKSVPLMEMTFALSQIMETAASFAQGRERAQFEMISGMLSNEANGRDHVRVVLQTISNGVRMRIEAEEGVLRAIGTAAIQAQMQAAQAAGGGPGGF